MSPADVQRLQAVMRDLLGNVKRALKAIAWGQLHSQQLNAPWYMAAEGFGFDVGQ